MKKCIFFDRDGVVNQRIVNSYVKSPSQFVLNMDFIPVLKYADDNNIFKIIVTNQQGISKGIMTEIELEIVHQYMNKLLNNYNINPFNDIYYAIELDSANPIRRKPSPKMIFEAMEKFNLNPQNCLLIGDSITDIQSANNANIKSIYYSESEYNLANLSTNNSDLIINYIKNVLINK